MNQEAFIDKYSDVKVKLSSYYKYEFSFTGSLPDGRTLYVTVGGNAGDIYNVSVAANVEYDIMELDLCRGCLRDQNGSIIDEFHKSF